MATIGDIELIVKVVSPPVKERCTSDLGDHNFDAAQMTNVVVMLCHSCAMVVEVARASGS